MVIVIQSNVRQIPCKDYTDVCRSFSDIVLSSLVRLSFSDILINFRRNKRISLGNHCDHYGFYINHIPFNTSQQHILRLDEGTSKILNQNCYTYVSSYMILSSMPKD